MIGCKANKLSLNIKKTQFMVFNLGRTNCDSSNKILINGVNIERVNNAKFLGVILDSKLSWLQHIKYLKVKVSKGIGILSKARKCLSLSTLLTMYYSLFIHISHTVLNAGAVFVINIWKLSTNYKKAVRILTSSPFRAPSGPLFRKLSILPISKYMFILSQFLCSGS